MFSFSKIYFCEEWICKSVWWWFWNSCLDLSFELQIHISNCFFESSTQMSFKNFKLTLQIFPVPIFYRWMNGKLVFLLSHTKTLRSSLIFLFPSYLVFIVNIYVPVTTLELLWQFYKVKYVYISFFHISLKIETTQTSINKRPDK